MSGDLFRALILRAGEGVTRISFESLADADLPPGDVLVAVEYSSLNYKDGLAVTGKGKIVRQYPMVPGVDFAGRVLGSSSPDYHPGDLVIGTGWGLGEAHWGGYAERARVPAEWLVPLPGGLDTRRAMALGTAGLTAMLAVMALEEAGVEPGIGNPVLVTGASGGLGSVAVAVLGRLGHRVFAVTGRPENAEYLRALGAAEILDRAKMDPPARPLEAQRWAGAVDAVGGTTLARVLSETRYGGAVAACGLAGGAELHTTVMPFILRGVSLIGINSVSCPAGRRRWAWERLAQDLSVEALESITRDARLEDVPALAEEIVAGRVRGRVVVAVGPVTG